jgi:hypothetical protein
MNEDVLKAVFNNVQKVGATKSDKYELYKEDSLTFQFKDYGILLNAAKGAKSALEFGPGSSTLALIEAGVPKIVTCEYDPGWREIAKEKFAQYPQVTVIPFLDEPEAKADIEGEFDLAFVDSPKGYKPHALLPPGGRKKHPGQEDCSRLNTCLLALKHAPVVYLHDAFRPLERGTLGRLSAMGHKVSIINTKVGIARIDRNVKEQGRSSPEGS